jgi:hypothetical protein
MGQKCYDYSNPFDRICGATSTPPYVFMMWLLIQGHPYLDEQTQEIKLLSLDSEFPSLVFTGI